MVKEIKLTFEKYVTTDEEVLGFSILLNGYAVDNILLESDNVLVEMRGVFMEMFGIEDNTLESYLSIPEIKAMYDEHFKKKEIDLFSFLEIGKTFYYVDRNGLATQTVYCKQHDELFDLMKEFYNVFPTEELCEKAKPMALDERKQLLFANAKGYEVLTREEAIKNYNDVFVVCYNRVNLMWCVTNSGIDCTYNIYFKTLEHAQECVDFMNGVIGGK